MELVFSLLACLAFPLSFSGRGAVPGDRRSKWHNGKASRNAAPKPARTASRMWGSHRWDVSGGCAILCHSLILLVFVAAQCLPSLWSWFVHFSELWGHFSSSAAGGSAWPSECFVPQPAWNSEAAKSPTTKRTPAGRCQTVCAVCRGCSPGYRAAERGFLETQPG